MSASREGAGGGELLHVITSFHLKLSRDVLEDNVKMALANARTRGVAAVHVLLEGSEEELLARIDSSLADQLKQGVASGRLVLKVITARPTYFDVFTYANTLGDAHVAIANSDIVFPEETAERICTSGLKPGKAAFALTRWNVTLNGIYIQGMTPSPPWPETSVAQLQRHQRNYFSYDAYVFRAPIAIPPDTAGVFVGSLGCDTTLAAVMKAAGYAVSNPTLALPIAHFDVKPRSYRSPSSIADLDRNVDAMNSALRRPDAGLTEQVKALLDEGGRLAQGRIWFGHPAVGRFGRALQRAIGATPWSRQGAPEVLEFRKIRVDRSEIDARTFNLAGLIEECERKHIFIEWELTGYGGQKHIIDALLESSYRDMTRLVEQYQWQALLATDALMDGDRALYDDVMALFRRTLAPVAAAGTQVADLSADAAHRLGARMAGLMKHDLEDEEQARQRAEGPAPILLMIDPDALNAQGHYLAYDLQLQQAAAAKSIETSFLLNAKMDPALAPQGARTYRLLESHSWEIASQSIEHPRTDAFVTALSSAIEAEQKARPGRPLIIYMYCGSFEHARLVQEAMAKFDGVGAVIHLFWLSVDAYKSEAYLDRWAHYAASAAKDPRIRLTVATDNIQAILRKKTGVFFDVAPHPSTTFADGADISRWAPRRLEPHEAPVVLFPGAMREEKGFAASMEAVRSLSAGGDPKFRCVVAGRSRHDTPRYLVEALASARNSLVRVEDRVLDDDQFIDFLASGDIVVLPYRAAAFADRPSGILIDMVTLGRPIVAIEGTWLADAVRHYGWGEVVADDGGAAIAAAVRRMRPRYQQYLDALRTSREGYMLQHSWARLVKSIVQSVRPGAKQPFHLVRTVSHDRSERIAVDETGVVARLLAARRGRKHLMLDVGAHIGTSAAYFHPLDWTIHCFEPDPANRAKLEARFGNASNVHIDTRAVSDKPATGVSFFKSEESTGISALHAFRDSHHVANLVDVTTVQEFVDRWGIERVDFLKIDVEGFDFSVLRGVPWDRLKPDVIECEYEDAKTRKLGHTWEDIAKFLKELGYAVYVSEWHPIIRYGIEHDWRRVVPYPGREIPADSWGNLLAFRVDPGYAAVKEAFDAMLHRRAAPAPAQPAPAPPPPPAAPAADIRAPDDLRRFKDIHAGKRCFVMGNGPSLNRMDLSKLDGEIVFGCNSVFLLFDRVRWRPAYYTCVDSRVLPDRATEITAMLRANPAMQAFFPTELLDHISKINTPTRSIVPPLANVAYFREQWNSKDYPPFSMFSTDINEHVIQPYTVAITMLQIAMYMGFSEIYLIGCDTSYKVPADVQREGLTDKGEIGLGLTSVEDNDPNHFDPRYFGKGRKWHDPQTDKMIEHYGYAKQVSELKGRTKIYNATVGGNLEVFERVDFNSLFGAAQAARRAAATTNDNERYIRPAAVTPPPAVANDISRTPMPVAAIAGASGAARTAPLTLFPISAGSLNGASGSANGHAAHPEPAVMLDITKTQPPPAIQATAPAAEAARPAPPQADAARPQPPARPRPVRDTLRWARSQLRRRRSAQLALVGLIGLVIAFGFLMAMPVQGDLRPMLVSLAGMGLLAVGGLYFAYRTLALAQRLTAENASLQQRLLHTTHLVETMQRDTVGHSARQTATINAIATRIERTVANNMQATDARLAQLKAQMQTQAQADRDQAARAIAAQLDQLESATRARIDALAGQAQAAVAAIEAEQKAVAEELRGSHTATNGSLEALVEQAAAARDAIAQINEDKLLLAEQLTAAIAQVRDEAAPLRDAQAIAQARIGELALQGAAVSLAIEGLAGEQASLAHGLGAAGAQLASLNALAGAEAEQASRLAERVAHVDDLVKAAACRAEERAQDLRRDLADIRTNMATAAQQQRTTGQRIAEIATLSEGATLETSRALTALGSQLFAVDARVTTSEGLLAKKADDAKLADLAKRHAELEKAVAAAEDAGADEIAALDARLKAADAAAAGELARIRQNIGDLAATSGDAALETARALDDLGARLTGVDSALKAAAADAALKADQARLADRAALDARIGDLAAQAGNAALETTAALSDLVTRHEMLERSVALAEAAGAEEMARIEGSIQTLDTRLMGELAGVSENVATKADAAALSDLVTRHEMLERSMAVAEAAGAEEIAKVEAGIAALEARLTSELAGVGKGMAAKADAVALSDLAKRHDMLAQAAKAAEAAGAETIARVEGKVQALDTRAAGDVAGVARKLAELTERHAGLERTVAAAEAAGADEVAALEGRIFAVKAAVDEKADSQEVAHVKKSAAEIGKLTQEVAAEASRGMREFEARLEAFDGRQAQVDAAMAAKADRAALEDLAARQAELAASLATAENAGADEVATLEKWLEEVSHQAARDVATVSARVEALDVAHAGLVHAVRNDAQAVSALEGELGAVDKRVADVSERLEAASAAFAAKADAEALTAIRNQVAELGSLSEQVTRQAFADIEAVSQGLKESTGAAKATAEQLTALAERHTALARAFEEAERAGTDEVSGIEQHLAGIQEQLDALGAAMADSADGQAGRTGDQIAAVTNRLDEVVERLDGAEKSAMVDNAALYQRFNRRLQPAHMQVLEKEWTRKLSVTAPRTALAYMAARATEIERELDGRLATSIEDILLRTLVAQATKGQSVEILEIGTLFGTGAAIMFDSLKNHFDTVHFTLLDPLEGYYSDGRPDILTGQPVTERTLRRNLARAGMQDDQVKIIPRLSTDARAIEEASERLYDVLVIDADHSYAGVKSDFENYARLVRLGGHIIFDDYGSEDWPDVKSYVDAEMPSVGFVAPVGASWRTSVFRVVKLPPAAGSRRRAAAVPQEPPPKAQPKRATAKRAAPKRSAKRRTTRR